MAQLEVNEWLPSTDIYDIVNMVDQTKRRFVEDEDETTLATGIFGFLGDTEAKKIQSAIVMTGELGNEVFPQRAKLDKNVISHAIYCNVKDINAVPSHMIVNLAIKEDDLDLSMKEDEFVFDHNSEISVNGIPFHLDYDIILRRYKRTSSDHWTYTAWYDMEEKNIISDITIPYLSQPYIMNFNNYRYIFLQALIRQVTITELHDTMVSSSVIDNKSFSFTFEDQLVDFDIYITEHGKTTRLRPFLYGDSIDAGVTKYCWYLYINDDTIRVGFDQKSYMPGLSAEIKIVIYTTLGSAGVFNYKTTEDEAGFYADFDIPFNSSRINCIVNCATPSTDGRDRRSMEELRKLTPKMAMSRGYITTETDLNNYFNLMSDETNRLALKKKVDNNVNGATRIWYCYFILKDIYNNVIPTNTLPIQICLDDDYCIRCEGGTERYIIPCGTTFCYNPETEMAKVINEKEIPEKYSDEYFGNLYYYRTVYNIIININPLYCAYYLSIINRDSYFQYNWVNENINLGFIVNTYHIERTLLSQKDEYRIDFTITQSVNEEYNLYYLFRTEDGEEKWVNNMRIALVMCKDGEPYRYTDAEIIDYDEDIKQFHCRVTLKTDDNFDMLNRLKILDLYEAGYSTKNYGYFEHTTKAYIYIYGKFEDGEYGKNGKDNLIPDMDEYTLINIYEMVGGLTLFENYTDVVNTRIRKKISADKTKINYSISSIPFIGEHYFISEDNVTYLMQQIEIKKAYIDYCLRVLENTMGIDFKFFNTYGVSRTYFIGDREKTGIGHIDIEMKFRMKLVNSGDTKTKQAAINFVKKYIENLNGLELTDTKELHIPNLLHDIKEEYYDFITYFEFMNYNRNRLGVNHIELRDDVDDTHIPREFISVRNRLNEDGVLEPCIDIEIVS